ncbi:hypothetical protein ACHAXA_004090 [Cyclostephanos tholiformis]|uniref:Bidirectional sugar transporter SWEET n=1 Tax=Cyclostephanos tholiformis TaxID=382380 RepID=A0ABD3R3J3_9STRA
MTSAAFIAEHYACPTIGAILSTLTFSAPIQSLKSCTRNGSLGALNPTPWAFMTGNCIGWLAYSYVTLDLFVFLANAPGLVISIWLNIGAMKLQYYEEMIRYSSVQVTEVVRTRVAGTEEDNNDNELESAEINEDNYAAGNEDTICLPHSPPSLTSHEWKVLQILIVWMVILSTTNLIPSIDTAHMKFVIGVAVNMNLIFFYAAPLSSVVTILRSKTSASIHHRTMIMMSLNAFFWCVYSLAIRDYYILLPNGIGLVLGLVQMMLCALYPIAGGDDDDTHQNTNLTEVV